MDTAPNEAFFDTVPVFEQFEGVADGDNYRPLPDDWALATADIVGSTKAIASGRYKAVNMAGASVISALLNALGRRDLPFVFGGDGALGRGSRLGDRDDAASAGGGPGLGGGRIGADLRAAIVPIDDIRAQGLDVRVARFQAAPRSSYAMFAGGGASWAEARDEGRPLRDRPRAGGHAARPDRPVLPLEPDRGASTARSSRSSPSRRRRQPMPHSSDWSPTSSRWPASRSAAAIRCRRTVPSSAFRRAAWISKRAPRRRRASGCGAKLSHPVQVWLTCIFDRLNRPDVGGFDPKLYKRDVAQQFRFPQVRRRPEDDHRRRRATCCKQIESG